MPRPAEIALQKKAQTKRRVEAILKRLNGTVLGKQILVAGDGYILSELEVETGSEVKKIPVHLKRKNLFFLQSKETLLGFRTIPLPSLTSFIPSADATN
jgi:hypothetical protein